MTIAEKEFLKYLNRFDLHPFKINIGGEEHTIGGGNPEFSVIVRKTPPIKELFNSASLALGEAFMRGEIEIEGDLYTALNLILSQIDKFTINRNALKRLLITSVSKRNQKKEVSSHYDIGNDFYKLWLDETLSYSCGYFKSENDTLKDAQYNKVDRILKKLDLKEGMTLCDIGCGWGFLLTEAAKKYNIKGLGITLSREQKNKFEERIAGEGLENSLSAELMDYRDLPALGVKFDRVVSVGMLEHVGRKSYGLFMETVKQILKPQGLFLLHFISSIRESSGDPWIKKYIFPGGMIPSIREIISAACDSNFMTIDVESLRRHYAKTLLMWNDNFQACREEAVKMFSEEFAKMWELYLCACAAAFQNGIVDLHQILFTNTVNNSLPATRWY